MKWLVLAVIILAQQPAKAPEGKGTAETNNAQDAAHTKSTTQKQAPSAQSAPAPTQASIAMESQRSGATASDHTGTSSQQTSGEDRATQRKLTWFTGVLAGVGVLQLVVMSLTWLIYRRQAHEMRRQRHEMRRQRHVMSGQWKAMREQLRQMESSGRQTEELIKQTTKNADAALLNAQSVINAERPVLIIKSEKSPHPMDSRYAVFKISAFNHGRTPARVLSTDVTETVCVSADKELQLPYPSPIAQFWTHKAIAPREPSEIAVFVPRSQINKERMVAAIADRGDNASKCYLVVYGEVRYCEMGANGEHPYWTRFCYRHAMEQLSDVGGSLILCGPREYNEMT